MCSVQLPLHPGLSGGRIKKKSNSLPGHLRTTAPLIREKGSPPLGFRAASPHCQHSHCGHPDTGRGKRQEFPLPLNIGNPLSYSLNQNSKASFRTVSVPVSTSVYWITPNPGWDTGEKKGKKNPQEMQYCSSGTLYSGLFSHSAYVSESMHSVLVL